MTDYKVTWAVHQSTNALRRKFIRYLKRYWKLDDWVDTYGRYYPGYKEKLKKLQWYNDSIVEIKAELTHRGERN